MLQLAKTTYLVGNYVIEFPSYVADEHSQKTSV